MTLWKVALWIAGIVGARLTINTALPASVLGVYPQPSGWLHFARRCVRPLACCLQRGNRFPPVRASFFPILPGRWLSPAFRHITSVRHLSLVDGCRGYGRGRHDGRAVDAVLPAIWGAVASGSWPLFYQHRRLRVMRRRIWLSRSLALNVVCCETAIRLQSGGKAEMAGAHSKRR